MDGSLLIEGSKLGAPDATDREDKVMISIHKRSIGPNDLLLGVDVGDIVGDFVGEGVGEGVCPRVLV